MSLPVFQLEEFLGYWEFKAPYLLCCSDAETWSLQELLSLAESSSLKLWENLALSYTEVQGLPALRGEIADLYVGYTDSIGKSESADQRLGSDNILCFAGAEEGIFCAAQALLQNGDHAIVVTPCYQSLRELPKHAGAEVTTIELLEAANWDLDLARVQNAIRDTTRMLIINYPHNPTGARLGNAKLMELIELARKHQIIIFSDEVYRLMGPEHLEQQRKQELEHKQDEGQVRDQEWEPPVAAVYELGLSLGVMSKAYGLAGLRIGWLASQNREILKKIERVKHYTSICNSAPAEVLSLIALRAKNVILARNNKIVSENLKLLDTFFEQRGSTFSWVRPTGGCIGFPRYHGSDGIDKFCQQLVETTGVLLLPGRVYDTQTNNFRIGFGRKNMPQALARLEQFCDKV